MPNPQPQQDSKPPMISIQDVHLAYRDNVVLDGINLTVNSGEILAILGPSGTGKSSLVKIISGLLKPTLGKIVLQSERIGLAFQDGALFSSFTVAENISFVLEHTLDIPETEVQSRIDESLKLVGLYEARDKHPSELSGGMQKRVGIARALAIYPDIMLYDEPSAGLDPILAHKLEDELKQINEKRQMASILISHELPTIQNLATRVMMLYQGRIVYQGSKDDFFTTNEPYALQFRTRRETGPIAV